MSTRRATTIAAPDWTDAVCRGVDPDLFFPLGDTSYRQIEDAKKVCAGCPIRSKCLDWALETRQDSGVWGGLSERERRTIHRRHTASYWSGHASAAAFIWNERLDEYRELVASGARPGEIARALGTNVQTLNTVQARLEREQAQEVAA